MNRRIVEPLLTAGAFALLWLSLAGIASAQYVPATPELDPGSAASGIALAVGAAVLMAERYRRRK